MRFVATTGSDTANTCLVSASPCLTLGHALAQADDRQHDPTRPRHVSRLRQPDRHRERGADGAARPDDPVEPGRAAPPRTRSSTRPARRTVSSINAEQRHGEEPDVPQRRPQGIVADAARATPSRRRRVDNLTLTGNVVTNNDLCSQHPAASDCPPQNQRGLPFGEGIELSSVVDSTVTGNTVTGNWGGILVDRRAGPEPRQHDLEQHREHNGDAGVCGIDARRARQRHIGSARGRDTGVGGRSRSLAGVYDNTISGNTVNGNGATGIILAGSGPGDAVYGNTSPATRRTTTAAPASRSRAYAPGQDIERQRHHRQPPEPRRARRRRRPAERRSGRQRRRRSRTPPASSCCVHRHAAQRRDDHGHGRSPATRSPTCSTASGCRSAHPRANVSGNTTTVDPGGAAILVATP